MWRAIFAVRYIECLKEGRANEFVNDCTFQCINFNVIQTRQPNKFSNSMFLICCYSIRTENEVKAWHWAYDIHDNHHSSLVHASLLHQKLILKMLDTWLRKTASEIAFAYKELHSSHSICSSIYQIPKHLHCDFNKRLSRSCNLFTQVAGHRSQVYTQTHHKSFSSTMRFVCECDVFHIKHDLISYRNLKPQIPFEP